MQKKLIFVVGAAIGYVVGTRTGRAGYERLKHQAADVWQNPRVKKTVTEVEHFAKDKVPVVGEGFGDLREKVDKSAQSVATSSTTPAGSHAATPAASDSDGSGDSTSTENNG